MARADGGRVAAWGEVDRHSLDANPGLATCYVALPMSHDMGTAIIIPSSGYQEDYSTGTV